eukprot:symbB.v1.2.004545.t2/scaffold245.1/size253980/2
MGVVDRTDEFRQILREAAAKSGGGLNFETTPQATSELNRWSAEIGSEIHEASQQVGELRKMSKQKGIFNDKTNQIQVLTHTVKQQIQVLNQKIEALESKSKSSGKNKSYQAHASTLVETLKTRLLQVTKEFKDALEDRTKALEQQDIRRQMYSSGAGAAGNPFAGLMTSMAWAAICSWAPGPCKMAKVDQCIDACQLEQEAKGDDIILSEMHFDDNEKLPLLPSPGHVAVPLGHVWDVLLPADGYNRKLSGYDAYVTRLPAPFGAFLPEARPCDVGPGVGVGPSGAETPPSKMEVVEAVEPVLFGAIVPERSEKLIRAEVEGVPFEVVARVPFGAKPGQIIDVNLGADSEYEVVVPPGASGADSLAVVFGP